MTTPGMRLKAHIPCSLRLFAGALSQLEYIYGGYTEVGRGLDD